MKNLVRNLTVVGCISSSAIAAPFLAIGDNAELFVTGEASAAYNDNILLTSSNEAEDTIVTFVPGFDLQFGKDSAVKGNVFGNATLTSYADNNDLNNQLLGTGANAAFSNGGPLTASANASFNELDQATVDVRTIVEREVTKIGAKGELEFSEKISAGAGVAYGKTNYRAAGYAGVEDYTVPLNVYYELTPKVDVSTGVTYTRTELDQAGANKYDAVYYNVGARGSFTPKLSGNFSVGYNTRTVNVGPDDDDSIGADASLGYAYSEKTQFNLAANRNFTNSSVGGDSYENTQLVLSASNSLAADWRLNASLTYRMLDYQNKTQTDDYVEGSVGATYVINEHLSSSLSFTLRDNSSDTGPEFKNNVVSLSLSARY